LVDGRRGVRVRGRAGRISAAAGIRRVDDGVEHRVDDRRPTGEALRGSSRGRSYSSGRDRGGRSGRGIWRDEVDDGERRPGSVGTDRGRRDDIGRGRSRGRGGGASRRVHVDHGVSSDAGDYSASDGCASRPPTNLGNDDGRRGRGDDVNDRDTGRVTGHDGIANRDERATDRVNGDSSSYDSDRDHGSGCMSNAGGGSASGTTVACQQSNDSTRSEEDQSQSVFIRQQRMKWLESKSHTTTKQSDSQTRLVTTEGSGGRSENESNPTVSTVRRPGNTAAVSRTSSIVATRVNDTTSRADDAAGGQRPKIKTEPATTSSVGTETQQTKGGNGKKCIDKNPERDCRNSQTGNRDKIVTIAKTTNDNNKKEPGAAKENHGHDDHRSGFMPAPDAGISERPRTESDSRLQRQRVVLDSRPTATLKLTSGDNQSLESRPKAAAVDVHKVETVSVSICSDPPSSGSLVPSSTRNKLDVISTHHSTETPENSDNAVLKTAHTVSPGLHRDVFRADSESASRSDEVLKSSYATSSYVDEPLNDDAFDVYVKQDGLDLWSQGYSTSESLSAQLHDFQNIKPTESIADTSDTLLKLPVFSASVVATDKRDEVCSGETQTDRQKTCENVTSNTPDMGRSASNMKTLPSNRQLWTCVYSRKSVGVGEVLTRFSPTFSEVRSPNSVPGDARTTAASIEGMCDKNEVIRVCPQTSNVQSAAYSPVCHTLNDRDAPTHDTKEPVSKDTSQCDATSQEFVVSAPEELNFNSANDKSTFHVNVRGRSSGDIALNSTVQESVSRSTNATDEPGHSLPTAVTSRRADADNGDRLTDTEYEIPAEMEADFVDQMRYETCPDASPSSTEDFSCETLLRLIVTHVVDARHFWGQIVNEGVQVTFSYQKCIISIL